MKILVTGGTGLVGKRLCLKLVQEGHELFVISNSSQKSFSSRMSYPCHYLSWKNLSIPEGIDAVVHLAGESIAEGRWTDARKKSILASRVDTTNALYQAFEQAGYWPQVFIGASAIGIYGSNSEEELSEEAPLGADFLSDVCIQWEKSVSQFQEKCRLVQLRIGVVLDQRGGLLQKMEPIFCKSLGGVVGSGQQWMSWIHWQDLQQLFLFALNDNQFSGVFNAVSPQPVQNKKFTQDFASQLNVSAPFPAPSPALKLILGEMSQIALEGQKVSCDKVIQKGFTFLYPSLPEALANLYSWKTHPLDHMFFSDQYFPIERKKVYSFFSEVKNLQKITPDSLNFEVVSQSSPEVSSGTKINYKLRVHGVPIKWTTLIKKWDSPHEFIDTQEKGPYAKWHHTHRFSDLAQGTLMTDEVIYRVPVGWLGNTIGGWFVHKDVKNIFAHRTLMLDDIMRELSK